MKTKISTLNNKDIRSSTFNLKLCIDRKVVLIGDAGTGKTSMVYCYSRGSFPTDYIPTMVESEDIEVTPLGTNEYPLTCTVWDTAGQEDYDRLRPMSYSHTDVFIICYSIDDPVSYYNVVARWIPELTHFSPEASLMLVATKADLRYHDDVSATESSPFVTTKQGKLLAKKIKASTFLECSATNQEDIQRVFQTAALLTMVPLNETHSGKKEKPCKIL